MVKEEIIEMDDESSCFFESNGRLSYCQVLARIPGLDSSRFERHITTAAHTDMATIIYAVKRSSGL